MGAITAYSKRLVKSLNWIIFSAAANFGFLGLVYAVAHFAPYAFTPATRHQLAYYAQHWLHVTGKSALLAALNFMVPYLVVLCSTVAAAATLSAEIYRDRKAGALEAMLAYSSRKKLLTAMLLSAIAVGLGSYLIGLLAALLFIKFAGSSLAFNNALKMLGYFSVLCVFCELLAVLLVLYAPKLFGTKLYGSLQNLGMLLALLPVLFICLLAAFCPQINPVKLALYTCAAALAGIGVLAAALLRTSSVNFLPEE
ncbi:MAG: hypothetical protein GXO42_00950 [bacterium]|nr:hypothetical protein [bacterium]